MSDKTDGGLCMTQDQLLKLFLDLKTARNHAVFAEGDIIEALSLMSGKEVYAGTLKHAAGQAHRGELLIREALMDLLSYRTPGG